MVAFFSSHRRGLADFLFQRITAVIMLVYLIVISAFFVGWYEVMSYEVYLNFFTCFAVQCFSSVFILSFLYHSWIGMWTIGTDYLREHYFGRFALPVRITYYGIILISIVVLFFWGLKIIWRVS